MAETSIGKGSLILTTNSAGLDSGLAAAQARISSFASKAATGLKAGLVGAAAAIGISSFDAIEEKIKGLARVGRTSSALGIDNAQFQGLQMLLGKMGIEGDRVASVFLKMGHATTQAANGNKQLAGAFARIGVDAGALSKQKLDQQFMTLIGALHAMPEGAQRAELMLEIFGKQAGQLAPLMSKSKEEIQAFVNKQKSLGNALDNDQMNAVKKAAAAKAKFNELWSGFSNRVIVALLPVVEFISDKLGKVLQWLIPIVDKVARAFSVVGEFWGDVLEAAWDGIKEIIDIIQDWIKEIFGVGATTATVEEAMMVYLKALATAWAYIWDTVKLGGGVIATVAGLVVEGLGVIMQKIHGVLEGLKSLPEAIKPAWINQAVDGFGRASAAVAGTGQKMRAWGVEAIMNFGRSADQVEAWFAKRKKKVKDEAAEIADAMGEAMEEAAGKKLADLPGLIQGSKEAYGLEAKFRFEGEMALVGVNQKILNENQKMNKNLADIKKQGEKRGLALEAA